jgi:hypothetical protein
VQDFDCMRIDEPHCGHLQDHALIFGKQLRDHSLQFVRPWLGKLALQAKDHFIIRPITRDSKQDSFPFRLQRQSSGQIATKNAPPK